MTPCWQVLAIELGKWSTDSRPIMSDDQNPYESPTEVATGEDPFSTEGPVNYPGGLKTVLIIGLVGGLMVGLLFAFLGNSRSFPDEFVLPAGLLIWCGSFVLIAAILPGGTARKTARCGIAFLLSFPALILYVPVCGIVMASTSGVSGGPSGMMLGSVAAFSSVLFFASLLIRGLAHATGATATRATATGATATGASQSADATGAPIVPPAADSSNE